MPLQTCLDHKKHNWQSVVQMLKEARPVPAVVARPGSAATKVHLYNNYVTENKVLTYCFML